MGLTMERILNKFNDCNKFSLTGPTFKYNLTISEKECERKIENLSPEEVRNFLDQFNEHYNITEEEFVNALVKLEEYNKENVRKLYENNKEKFVNYPNFDELYDEIKQECYEFYSEENKQAYINKYYDDKKINQCKEYGMTEEEINEMKEDSFKCSYIADHVGKTTKYGNEHCLFFYQLYRNIGTLIECKKDKKSYAINSGISPLEQIPEELKKYFLYYEVAYFNSVTISSGLMINYYFELNYETKKYLLQFQNDFQLEGLEDLTLYKDNEIRFYSCTHERYNSIDIDYKSMNDDEILDFINDENPEINEKIFCYSKNDRLELEENNDEVIEIVKKLIDMEVGTRFSFEEIGISSKILIQKIHIICEKLGLELDYIEDKEDICQIETKKGYYEKVN